MDTLDSSLDFSVNPTSSLSTTLKDPIFWLFILILFVINFIGYKFGSPNNSSYPQLIKPKLQPPPFVFGIVWFIIYILIAYAGYRAYYNLKGPTLNRFYLVYFLNLIVNLSWSIIVFGQQQYRNGIYIIIGLSLSTTILMGVAYRQDPVITFLLLPYLLWLLFALYLNWELVKLNNL